VKSSGGGSTLSLYGLVRLLNKDRYIPIILFYFPNFYYSLFTNLGLKIILMNKKNNNIETASVKNLKKNRSYYYNILSYTSTAIKKRILFLHHCFYQTFAIAKILKNEKVDLIHFNNSLHYNLGGIFASKILRIPQIIHVRGFRKLSIIDKIFAKFVNIFIFISEAVKRSYYNQGIRTKENKVIYNPIDYPKVTSGNANQSIRSEFEISNEDILICNIGRLDWWKGQDYFIEAVSYAKKLNPNIKGLIVGPKIYTYKCMDYFKRLNLMVKKLQLSDNIIFTGHRSDVPEVMKSSNIVVHSASKPEPFGRVIVEGMLAGKPVVATSAGGVLDIIDDGINGLLVPLKDSVAMASAIIYLIRFPYHAKKIGEKAQKLAEKKFNSKTHVESI
jgi:glycosyltransferase involved in cell wall biosynthesis